MGILFLLLSLLAPSATLPSTDYTLLLLGIPFCKCNRLAPYLSAGVTMVAFWFSQTESHMEEILFCLWWREGSCQRIHIESWVIRLWPWLPAPPPPAPAYEHSENAFHPYNNPSSLSSAAVHQHYLHPHLEMKKLWLRVVRLLLYKRDRAWILAQMCLKLEPWLDMPFTFFSPEILKGSGMYIFVSTQCAINVVQVNECVNEWASFSESVSLFVR